MLSMKLHSQPAYDEKYIKTKEKTFNEVVNANFSDDKLQKKAFITFV